MINRTGPLTRSEQGIWAARNEQAELTFYQQKLIHYLNSLDKLFEQSREKSEYDFVCTLLNLRRLKGVKWDSFETLKDVQEIFDKVNDKFGTWKGANTHTGLFRYGLIVESDELYGFIWKLLKCLGGEPQEVQPFPPVITIDAEGKEKTTLLTPTDKIAKIKKQAKKAKATFNHFDDFYDNKLRNAVFHSRYWFDAYEGELTLIGSSVIEKNGKIEEVTEPDTVYDSPHLLKKLNSAFAFFDALVILIRVYKQLYEGGEELDGNHHFAGYKFKTIAKDEVGLVGIVEVDGPINQPFALRARMGKFNPEEIKRVEEEVYHLPLSPNEKAQKRIDAFPQKLRKYVARYYKKKLGY